MSVDVADRVRVVDMVGEREKQADELVRAVGLAAGALGLSVFWIAEQLEKRGRSRQVRTRSRRRAG